MSEKSFCDNILFIKVVKAFEDICSTSVHEKKVRLFKQFLSMYRDRNEQFKDDTFFPIFRLFLPQLDHERGAYGLKEHSLARIYVRILGLAKQSKDAQKLLNYRIPKNSNDVVGDFAEVAYFILKPRCPDEGGKLTVYDVNQSLNNIANKDQNQETGNITTELQTMFLKMSALEQKWFIRIMLKNMKFGIAQNKMLNIFHEDAKDLYDVCNDLMKVCATFKDPSIRLHEIEINIFEPFRPMLSQRCDVQDVLKDLPKLDYYFVELKFDGERFQMHYNDGQYKYFSRNGFEYTDIYGYNSSHGTITPYISKQLSSEVISCILDGEMMCWNTKLKSFTTKGKNIDVKHLRIGNVHQPCFCVFDIVYYNGQILTGRPYEERIQILDKVLTSQEGIIIKADKDKVKSGKEIMNLLNKAIDDCEEGIIVKEPQSIYKPNSRKAGWYKIKPEYTDGTMVELDLLIIGGYYGEGNKKGIINQFLVALASNDDTGALVFKSFSRVGSGYSREELSELNEKLRPFWKKTKFLKLAPNSLQWSKGKPDLWIEPEKSFILQVKATETISSNAFKVGYTLRFPRVQRIRYDKKWNECMTESEFHTIRKKSCGKLRINHATVLNPAPEEKPQQICSRMRKICPTVSEEYQPIRNPGNVKKVSNILQRLEMCVLTGYREMSKNDIEKKIIENDGVIVQNAGKGTYCILADDTNNIRVNNAIKLKYDVVRIDWIIKCFDKGRLINRRPEDFFSVSAKTADALQEAYDSHGDSYTEQNDLDGLIKILNNMEKKEPGKIYNIDEKDLIKLEGKLFLNNEDPYTIFKNCVAYFDSKVNTFEHDYDGQLMLNKTLFEICGGCVQRRVDDAVTHIVVHSRTTSEETLKGLLQLLEVKNYFLVNEKWIEHSFYDRKRLNEFTYHPSIVNPDSYPNRFRKNLSSSPQVKSFKKYDLSEFHLITETVHDMETEGDEKMLVDDYAVNDQTATDEIPNNNEDINRNEIFEENIAACSKVVETVNDDECYYNNNIWSMNTVIEPSILEETTVHVNEEVKKSEDDNVNKQPNKIDAWSMETLIKTTPESEPSFEYNNNTATDKLFSENLRPDNIGTGPCESTDLFDLSNIEQYNRERFNQIINNNNQHGKAINDKQKLCNWNFLINNDQQISDIDCLSRYNVERNYDFNCKQPNYNFNSGKIEFVSNSTGSVTKQREVQKSNYESEDLFNLEKLNRYNIERHQAMSIDASEITNGKRDKLDCSNLKKSSNGFEDILRRKQVKAAEDDLECIFFGSTDLNSSPSKKSEVDSMHFGDSSPNKKPRLNEET